MTEMIARIADAIANMPDGIMDVEAVACVALRAMREPTIEMCDAATRSTSAFLNLQEHGVALRRLKHSIRWRAMITAALGEIP